MFDINVFKISLKKSEVDGCTEDTIGNITGKLNNEKNQFNENLKTQFEVLKNKYKELNDENNKKVGSEKVSYGVENIEAIIKKTDITIEEFVKLNNELNGYDTLLKEGVDAYKKGLIEEYKKDMYKNKFNVAKAIDSTFKYVFETDYNNLTISRKLDEIQKIKNNITTNSTKADKIIGDKKEALNKDILEKLNEYNNIFINLSLELMGIVKKNFSDLNTIDISTGDNYNNVISKLKELTDELNKIKSNFKEFFIPEFTEVLENAKGCELIDHLETYINMTESDEAKKDYLKNCITNITKEVENYFKKKSEKNIYIKVKKNEKDGSVYLCLYNKYFNNFCREVKNEKKLKNIKDEVIREDYSNYCIFSSVDIDNTKQINIDIDPSLIEKDKAYILFYTIRDSNKYDFFFLKSIDNSLKHLIRYCSDYTNLCSELKILKISKGIKNMESMFSGFSELKSLDLSMLDTDEVTDMSSMFSGCSGLQELDLKKIKTAKVTNMSGMFYNCSSLKSLDLSNFETNKVTNMSNMFNGCSSLQSLDLSNFETGNVTNMKGMFSECGFIDFKLCINTSMVTDMRNMFSRCSSLQNLTLNINTGKVEDMSSMFSNCEKLIKLDIGSLNTSAVKKMNYMFEACKALGTLNLSTFNTDNVAEMTAMFERSGLITITFPSNFGKSVKNMSSMFKNCENLTELDLSNFKTNNVTDMKEMFSGCKNLITLNIDNFTTDNVENMSKMFESCNSLKEINFPETFTTNKVTDMSSIFYCCSSLTKLDLNNWKDENLGRKWWLFRECTKLSELGLINFNFSNLKVEDEIFKNCEGLKTIVNKTLTKEEFNDLFNDCPKEIERKDHY